METPASTADLQARWHPNPLTDAAAKKNAQVKLDEAWRALQGELPGVAARVTAGTLDNETVVDVLCSAVLRQLRNPDGYVKGSVSIDDRTKTWELPGDGTSADLYFTAAELRRLTPTAKSGAFTIRPGSVMVTGLDWGRFQADPPSLEEYP